MNAPVVVVRSAMRSWGGAATVGPVDLTVAPGERIALMGPNGAGKSTLLRMVASLLLPTSGSVSVARSPAGSLPARAALSYLPDHPVLYDDLSLWEQCEYVARLHAVDDWESLAGGLLSRIGLIDRADDLPTTYSRGMRAKAATALALVRPFRVLVADEPLQGLDLGSQEVVIDLFEERAAHGAALLVATHGLEHLAGFDRLVTIVDGAITYDGPVDETRARETVG